MKCQNCTGKVTVSNEGTITRLNVVDICQKCGWYRKREVRWMQSRPDIPRCKDAHRLLRQRVRNK